MRILPGVLLLSIGLAACASRSEESREESTRVSTDTLVEMKQVVDTIVVRTDSTIAADTAIHADTTIAVDTTIIADTTVARAPRATATPRWRRTPPGWAREASSASTRRGSTP